MQLNVHHSIDVFSKNLAQCVSDVCKIPCLELYMREKPTLDLICWQTNEKYVGNVPAVKTDKIWPIFMEGKCYAVFTAPTPVLIENDVRVLIEAVIHAYVNYKDIEHKLQHYKTKFNTAQESRKLFLSTVSHELKTPINGIMGATQLLSQQVESNYLTTIMQCSLQLLECVNDILDYCRLKSNTLQLVNSPFRLHRVAKEISDMAEVQAVPKQVRLRWIDLEHLLTQRYVGDASRLRQLLQNVVHNAIRFSPEGGEVTVGVTTAGSDMLRFTVTDQGPGVPVEKRATLFQAIDGGGLGLVITKALCDRMNGRVLLDETYKSGARFVVEVQLKKPKENVDASILKGKTVIIVEEELAVRSELLSLARKWEMLPQLCSSGADALLCISAISYDIAWVDIFHTITEFITGARRLSKNLQFIGLSSVGLDFNGAHLFARLVEKPINAYDLLEASATLLAESTTTETHPRLLKSQESISLMAEMLTLKVLASNSCGVAIDYMHCLTDLIAHSKVVTDIEAWIAKHPLEHWDVILLTDVKVLDRLMRSSLTYFILITASPVVTPSQDRVLQIRLQSLQERTLRDAFVEIGRRRLKNS